MAETIIRLNYIDLLVKSKNTGLNILRIIHSYYIPKYIKPENVYITDEGSTLIIKYYNKSYFQHRQEQLRKIRSSA